MPEVIHIVNWAASGFSDFGLRQHDWVSSMPTAGRPQRTTN
jgi:hypothetical protein